MNQFEINELVERYIHERHLRNATKKHFRKVAIRFQKDTAITSVDLIQREIIVEWQDSILSQATPVTSNNYLRHMSTLLNYAVEIGLIKDNPFRKVKRLPVSTGIKKTVSQELLREAMRFLGSPKTPMPPGWFWQIVLQVLYRTGVRRQQLVGLKWKDINFKTSTMLLRAETSKTKREWTIPIDGVAKDLLQLRDETRKALGESTALENLQVFNITLFNSRYSGNTLAAEQITGFFKRLGLLLRQPISAHRLRHTMATELASHGNITTLKEILGHTDIRTTSLYVHPNVDQMRKLMGELINLRQ